MASTCFTQANRSIVLLLKKKMFYYHNPVRIKRARLMM